MKLNLKLLKQNAFIARLSHYSTATCPEPQEQLPRFRTLENNPVSIALLNCI